MASTQTQVDIAKQKRRMCNELVFELCRDVPVIGMLGTSWKILLTSVNIHTYLEQRFRKTLVYRDAINFLKANIWNKFLIIINQDQYVDENGVVVVNQEQTEGEYELWTEHLYIRLSTEYELSKSQCLIDENAFEDAHVHFFLQLIAPQLRPIVLNLYALDDSTFASAAACFLHKMNDCIDWLELYAHQISLESISAELNKFNKLKVSFLDMYEDQMQQFCEAFIRWINASNCGQPKMCAIYDRNFHRETILRLLDAINKDFAGATNKRPFDMRIEHYGEPLAELTVRNARTRERLQLRRTGAMRYMLVRHPIAELDNHKQLELEFNSIKQMFSVAISNMQSDDSFGSDDSDYSFDSDI